MTRYLKEFYRFIRHIFESRALLISLTKNEFRKEYLGSYLGLIWAILQPLSFIFVIWFVFEVGFRTGPVTDGIPFFLWLLCGMVPWFFFANSVTSGTNAVISNAYLVKKVAFRVSILPLVQIGSALMVHVLLLLFTIMAFFAYGKTPSIYWLQLPYFIFCTVILVLGISWLTSALRVFIKDIGNLVAILLQLGFWFTPIFWSADIIPEQYRYLIKLNPMFYIIDGYRDTFINGVWFWEQYKVTPYFLLTAGTLFVVGAIVFKKLRPHFADVL
ncbi:MAG: ABC transporter permease [Campylobacterales bacterium]|nr:ABC transporter permease [Campylobacterales bacterium]